MNGFRLWRRWDPRIEAMPLREVMRVNHWLVEVVPDLFEPGHEGMRDAVLRAIGKIEPYTTGRFMLRTAHPGRALKVLRGLADTYQGGGSDSREMRQTPSRCVLAVYAETQAELDARIAELRTPRVLYEQLALTDMDAAIKLALEERAISASYKDEEWKAAKAQGPAALSKYLKNVYKNHDRSTGFCVDTGGLALYLSPRERIDIRKAMEATIAETAAFNAKYGHYTYVIDDEGSHSPPREFEWVVVAGQIGPVGEDYTSGPWPIHPTWITDVSVAAKEHNLPFCVPHLGEWACYDRRFWNGDHTDTYGMNSSDALDGGKHGHLPWKDVDYDLSWCLGQRGWDKDNMGAKPSSAYMQAIGSRLVGRALIGRIFDDWPQGWGRH